MPLQRLRFSAGVTRESTSIGNEGTWFECDKVRFRSGQPEKIGGWALEGAASGAPTVPPSGVFLGVCRSLYNWTTLASRNLLGIGTHVKYYVEDGPAGIVYDITPIRSVTYSITAANSLDTSNGSKTITAHVTAHNAQTGDRVVISNAATLGGVPAAEINTLHTITRVDADTFQFTVDTAATGSVTGGGGVNTTYAFTIDALLLNGPFTATTGSTTLAVYAPNHGAQTGDYVIFSGASSLGGTVTASVLNAEYVVTIVDSDNFTITLAVAANASDTGHGGASVVAQFQATTGAEVTEKLSGWGAGGWGGVTAGLSGATGWGVATSTSLGREARIWTQSNYGENLILNPRYGPVYMWIPSGSTFNRAQRLGYTSSGVYKTDINGPLMANWVMVSADARIVVVFGTNPIGETTEDPLLVRWSAQEDYTDWTPTATNQAGFYRLTYGTELKCSIQMRQEVLVFTDSAVYSMQYLGPPYVYGFTPLSTNISIVGPNAVTQASNVAYWMGYGKFYTYSGVVNTLPCALKQYVFSDINYDQAYQFFATPNERFNEVWFFYCSANSSTIDRYVIYNYVENLWAYGTMARTAWTDSHLRTYPIAAGYDGLLIAHEFGVDDASVNPPQPIHAYIQSADFDIGDGHNYSFVWRMVPDITFDGSMVDAPSVDFIVKARKNPGAGYKADVTGEVISANDYSATHAYLVQRFTQLIYTRARGRQIALKVESNTLGTQWQVGAPSIDVRPDGRR